MSKSQGDGANEKLCDSHEAPPSGDGDAVKISKEISLNARENEKINNPMGNDYENINASRAEDELKQLKEFISEIEEKVNFKTKLRHENLRAHEDPLDESVFGKLDSNLKKTSAFVKKLKTITDTQKDSLIKDCKTFNLTRYIGEIASALVEAKLKMSDVNCVLSICSLIHQRYSDFSRTFMEQWQKNSLMKKDDKNVNLSKLRVDLRLFADLISVGIFPEKEALGVLAGQLSLLTTNDREEFNNLSIVISFCKHCGDDYAGLVPQRMKELAEKHGMTIPYHQFLKSDRQKACKSLLKDYYVAFSKHLISKCKEIRELEKQNFKMLKMRGELTSERKEKFESCQLNFQKLYQNALIFADLLGEPIPQLPKEEIKLEEEMFGTDVILPNRAELNEATDCGAYEDEDTRQFYESLPDLKSLIPGILYKDSEQAVVINSDIPTEEDLDIVDDNITMADELKEIKSDDVGVSEGEKMYNGDLVEVDTEEEASTAGTAKELFEAFLNNLPKCINRDLVDKAAIEFCMTFNTKANRRKLARTLYSVQRMRHDLLPFYSRLVATLHPCMPALSAELVSLLKDELNFIMRKKDQINIESKLKVVRFLGELTKFKMMTKSEALYCLKRFFQDFTHHNIEMACAFLEICGRYLYKSPDSYYRMKNYLDVMMRKKAAMHLDSRYITMIENAYYYSNPPENMKRETQKKLPPMFQYIERLLFKDLSKITVEKVLKQMRKLNWTDPEVKEFVVKSFSSIWKAKYNCIHCCANLLSGLCQYQEEVCYQVVDSVLENIRLGLEMIHPKYNQNRLSTVKYLGELYNFKVIESQVIFKTLYSFISFETYFDVLNPSPLDPPDYLFRIRLTCVLLETCGAYFNTGMSKKKLDCFLIYFQRYFWFKKSSSVWTEEITFPREIDNLVGDIFQALRPKMIPFKSWDEASKAASDLDEEYVAKVAEMVKMNKDYPNQNDLGTIAESEYEDIIADDDNATIRGSQDSEIESPSLSQKEFTDPDVEFAIGPEGDNFLPRKPKLIKSQEDDDFTTALDKMTLEYFQGRQQENIKTPAVEIAVPIGIKLQTKHKIAVPKSLDENKGGSISYTVLTKKGNKPQLSVVPIPVTEKFAARFKEQKKFELEEKEKMKKVVLEIHERQEEELYQAEMLTQQQAILSRERKGNFQHKRGAPDAEVIFGFMKK